jgi:hypothetical protein
MEIPLQAPVECTDGICGHSVYVLINPVSEQLTHLVVGDDASPQTETMVPVYFVTVTIAGTIQLSCTKAEFMQMNAFIPTRFIQEKARDYIGNRAFGMENSFYWPFVRPEKTVNASPEDRPVPVKEMAIGRGTPVEATDGYVGKVDEFVVTAENGYITHLVMRDGHLWGQKDVIIPVAAMGDTCDDTLFLKLDKRQLESLPTFPVHRLWS